TAWHSNSLPAASLTWIVANSFAPSEASCLEDSSMVWLGRATVNLLTALTVSCLLAAEHGIVSAANNPTPSMTRILIMIPPIRLLFRFALFFRLNNRLQRRDALGDEQAGLVDAADIDVVADLEITDSAQFAVALENPTVFGADKAFQV